ncbi:MAG: PEP-CTERM sorting domain-containing protein, partial [Puniceicoccaceae bacterium]
GSLGQWVQNNNSAATPGATVDPIWTYLQINDLDNLTGSSGFFAVLADDSNNVMGFQNGSGFLPTADGRGLLTAQAVPEPSTYGLIGALLLLGLIANRRLRAGRS